MHGLVTGGSQRFALKNHLTWRKQEADNRKIHYAVGLGRLAQVAVLPPEKMPTSQVELN
jgi:hypothetical protein